MRIFKTLCLPLLLIISLIGVDKIYVRVSDADGSQGRLAVK
jgi:hypothetical protein